MDVTKLSCAVRSQGHANPGGEYTMCGSDLQAYIGAVLPPPDTGTTALMASADSTLQRDDRNQNQGLGRRHELVPLDGNYSNDIVVRFREGVIERFLQNGELGSATLRLTVDASASDGDAWASR